MTSAERKKGFLSRLFKGEEKNEIEPAEAARDPETPATPEDGLIAPMEATASTPPEPAPSVASPASISSADEAPARPAAARELDGDAPEAPPKSSWLSRLKSGLSKTSSRLSDGITGLFTKRKLGADTLEDLEDLLIQADLGVETAMRITEALSATRYQKGISPDEVRAVLAAEVERVLAPVAVPLRIDSGRKPHVVLMVGVNGTGKTTTIGKLAQRLAAEGRKVMMAAGDTFRAAAIDQLKVWGQRSGATVIAREVGSDASGLAYDALRDAQAGGYDVLLVDTAGRLQNKQSLMEELEKVVRVLRKLDPEAPHDVLLVLDATTGQNAMQQVEVFQQRAGVTGLVLTKLDGTARGGIIVAIAEKHGLPVHAIGVGEGIDDLQPFDAAAFAKAIADI
ncbi:MAG: signal recognition particle-docking protein FtsY [Hyphomicrobiaceae bacterium]